MTISAIDCPESGEETAPVRVTRRACGPLGPWEDQSAPAAAGVLGDLHELRHIAELARFGELALANRPGIRVGEKDESVGDRLARHPLMRRMGGPRARLGAAVS